MRPVCGACSLRRGRCSYPSPSRPRYAQLRDEPRISRRVHVAIPQQPPTTETALQPLEFNVPRSSTGAVASQSGSLNMVDLKLLRHYLTNTAGKMSLNAQRKLDWQRVIPDLAEKEEYLMHLLLALAGVHLTIEERLCIKRGNDEYMEGKERNDDGEYSEKAGSVDLFYIIEHHQKGLQGFREALSTMSAATAESVFCGSFLLVAFAFASLRVRDLDGFDQTQPGDGDANGYPRLDWLHLIRGLTSVVRQHWFALKAGRLRTMFFYRYANDDWKSSPPSSTSSFPRLKHCSRRLSKFARGARQALSSLRTFTNTLRLEVRAESESILTSAPQDSSSSSSSDTDTLLREQSNAIDQLEETYMRTLHILQFTESEQNCSVALDVQTDLEEAAITSWPHSMPIAFICSLQSGGDIGIMGGALYTILAHFYLVHVMFEDLWYFQGAFEKEIMKIYGLVGKLEDDQLNSLMRWPMAVIDEP